MKIQEIHEHICMGHIVFRKKKGYILYSKNTKPHISVLQRGINCLNKENENRGFRENMDSDLQITYQSHYFYENLK